MKELIIRSVQLKKISLIAPKIPFFFYIETKFTFKFPEPFFKSLVLPYLVIYDVYYYAIVTSHDFVTISGQYVEFNGFEVPRSKVLYV